VCKRPCVLASSILTHNAAPPALSEPSTGPPTGISLPPPVTSTQPLPATTADNSESDSSGLSGSARAAAIAVPVAVGSVLLLAAAAAGLLFWKRRSDQGDDRDGDLTPAGWVHLNPNV
jgi:hypothetical protein